MSRHHVAPGAKPPRFLSQSQRLSAALRSVRQAMTHVRYAGSLHKCEPFMRTTLGDAYSALAADESYLCTAVAMAIDAEAKAGRAAP